MTSNEMLIKQPRLGKSGLILFAAVLGIAPPLSTDMYLPALPDMSAELGEPLTLVNLTMTVFFLCMAVGMLIWGPLSDQHGRKPMLIISLSMYALASAGCALSMNVWLLIIFRALQALGAGGMVSLSLAIVKDSFDAETRDSVLAIIQSVNVIGPIASPLLGAAILSRFSWHYVFVTLAIISFICIIITLLMNETLTEDNRNDGGVADSIRRLIVVGRNPNFTVYLLVMAIFGGAFMAYLAVASYMYIDFFGLTQGQFSIFFACNAALSVLGSLAYMKFGHRIQPKTVLVLMFAVGSASAISMYFLGHLSPFVFSACFVPYMIINCYARPYGTAILLKQQKQDTGSASSLLNFIWTAFSAIGMLIGSAGWSDYSQGLGITIGMFVAAFLIMWFIMSRSGVRTFEIAAEEE